MGVNMDDIDRGEECIGGDDSVGCEGVIVAEEV
jgi:hypothetical protein